MDILTNGRAKKSVKEATEILMQYGLSTSENVTRRLIREDKLKAYPKGSSERDKREGFFLYERDIYKYVTTRIPILKEYLPILEKHFDENTKIKDKKETTK